MFSAAVVGALGRLRAGTPGDVLEAWRSLNTAAQQGDLSAHEPLAVLAAAGIGRPQSWDAALAHLSIAADGGSTSARIQLEILAPAGAASLGQAPPPLTKRVLNESPRIVAIDDFLSPAGCARVISLSEGRLTGAMVYAADGPSRSTARTNSAFEFALADCDVVLLWLRARIAATIGVPIGALETPQVLHYGVGEVFARHRDYLEPGDGDLDTRGQRIVTFLTYLNDEFDGGETHFPLLGIRHRGGLGGALYFANLTPTGGPDPRTLHAGEAPTRGEKWVFSQWVRNRAQI